MMIYQDDGGDDGDDDNQDDDCDDGLASNLIPPSQATCCTVANQCCPSQACCNSASDQVYRSLGNEKNDNPWFNVKLKMSFFVGGLRLPRRSSLL